VKIRTTEMIGGFQILLSDSHHLTKLLFSLLFFVQDLIGYNIYVSRIRLGSLTTQSPTMPIIYVHSRMSNYAILTSVSKSAIMKSTQTL
jgi:hypothetical protein